MIPDPNALPRSSSPANSESSTRSWLVRGKEETFKKNKNYRRYASSVERALSLFDSELQEWADYISFLSRLLKALQSHPPDLPMVPRKVTVSKRLAQCLNPSLPSGVHQKALEVYSYIFGLIKPEGLSQDLPLYLPGIAPVLTFGSLSVRPLFLSLIETHISCLEPGVIRPALKAILLALLPGLEEETSDDFEPTLRLVNKFRNVASQMTTGKTSEVDGKAQYFWQSLFLASITAPSRRLGVLAYLNRYLPKLGIADRRGSAPDVNSPQELPQDMMAAANSVISPEPGLLIRCFASGLADENLLVQRNFLDLLVTHLPLNSPILQSRITEDDLERLAAAAVGVVIRRDMSLNRRLWAWLLGPEPTGDPTDGTSNDSPDSKNSSAVFDNRDLSQSQYFSRHGLKPLVNSLLKMIEKNSKLPPERARPFRISLSLMDRWEVGGFIVPAVFLPIIRSVQKFENTASSRSQFDEVFRSASAFFDGVESGVIFSELLNLVDWRPEKIETDIDKISLDLELAHFILENFNVHEEDMLLVHVPLLLLSALVKMRELFATREGSPKMLSNREVALKALVKVINSLLELLIERAFTRKATPEKKDANGTSAVEIEKADILRKVHDFYDQSKSSLDLPSLPFAPKLMSELILRESYELAILAVESLDDAFLFQEQISLLISLLKKLPKSHIFRDRRFYSAVLTPLQMGLARPSSAFFSVISSITSAVTSLYFILKPGYYISYEDISELIPALVGYFWQFLSPLSPKFHVEAVRCLWLLHSVTHLDHLVEASITCLMVQSPDSGPFHSSSRNQAERFYVLWNHSHNGSYEPPRKQDNDSTSQFAYYSSMLERPLFIVLDLLSQAPNESSHNVQRWLHDLSSIPKLLRIVISRLDLLFLQVDRSEATNEDLSISPDDFKECNYLLQTMSNVLSSLSHNGWITLLTHSFLPIERLHDESASKDVSDAKSLHLTIFEISLAIIRSRNSTATQMSTEEERLQCTSLFVLRQLLLGPEADGLVESGLDSLLIDRLSLALDEGSAVVQGATIDTLLAALKVRSAQTFLPPPASKPKHKRMVSRDRLTSASLLSLTSDKGEKRPPTPPLPQPPPQLLDCLLKGISSPKSREIVDKWVLLLCDVLPLYQGSVFQILLMLVECFCKEIQLSYTRLRKAFQQAENWPEDRSEHVTIALLAGLETCIANAHERLLSEEGNIPFAKSPDQPHGFFGNMVSGVFTSEGSQTRSTVGNNRLTVLLCFQDAVRICFSIWSWGATEQNGPPEDADSLASFQYTSLRMRNRSRRILEHLFTAEALECLETLVEMWTRSDAKVSALIFNLLHTLDGSRPKITIPAVFNAIYTRTNPSALDPSRKSAMASDITESELAGFLVTYARSLDDDVLDEIWTDCTTFLRDVLSNPFPHRHILPRLVEFAAILGAKMENTNFGEDRRMRRELGDVLLRLLTAIFTSKPLGLSQDPGLLGRPLVENERSYVSHAGPDDMLSILANSLPAFITTLGETDRISTAVTSISANVIAPVFRSRLFPNNVNRTVLGLLQQMAKIPAAARSWKKDVADAFNDARFFSTNIDLVKNGWTDILRQWILVDKDRLPDLMSRLPPPSTAGIMFGVGASAARLDTDRKAQLNLRRISLLLLAANDDYFVGGLSGLLQKLEDLLAATGSSSPSSATRAEIFMVLRALVLRSSTAALAPFWPLINTELQEAISSVHQGRHSDLYNPYSLLQACKLLDTLLVLAPDDFQLLEWLFVTDTIDAVYPPDRWGSVALADEVSQNLGARGIASPTVLGENHEVNNGVRRPWLVSDWIQETAKDEIVERVLRPFFDRLSIHAFESTYSMAVPDSEACRDDLLADLFNESTIVN